MGRLPLEIGEWGKINRVADSNPPEANCWFRNGRGERVRVSRKGKTPAAAERNLKAALESMRKAAVGNHAITRESTIEDLGKLYFTELVETGQKDGTIINYRSRYNTYILPQIGKVRLRQITVSRLNEVIRAQINHPSTAKTIRVILTNMFALAIQHDAMTINLAANTKPIKVEAGKVVALKPDKVQALLRLFELHDTVHGADVFDAILLLASTGTRTGEMLAFDWTDTSFLVPEDSKYADLAQSYPHIVKLIRKTKTNPDPKVSAIVRVTGTLVPDSQTGKLKKQPVPKSKASERGLTLPETAALRLLRRLRLSDAPYVFPSERGTYLWPNNFRRKWRSITKGTEFEGVTPKAFRKAVATYLDRAVGRAAAMEQLGHESEDITTTYYIEMEETVADFSEHLETLVGQNRKRE